MNSRHYSVAFDGEFKWQGGASLYLAGEASGARAKFSNPELIDSVAELQPGNYLLSRDGFGGLSPEGLRGSFVEIDEFARTRELSSRNRLNVFGQLILASDLDAEASKLVAIKPFETPRSAVYEHEVMRHLNKLSEPPRAHSSFKPLGFYAYERSSGGGFGLVTEYDMGVISYDNVFLNPNREPSREEVQKALGYIGLSLGYLHSIGLSFGDDQVRNFAHGNNGVRYIDVESIRSMLDRDGEISSGVEPAHRVFGDLKFLLETLNQHEDYEEAFRADFLPVYQGMVRQPRSVLPEYARLDDQDASLYLF